MPLFRDRIEAGRRLAEELRARITATSPLILALPPGGVPIAAEIAAAVNADLDIVSVQEISPRDNREFVFAAVAPGDICIINEAAVQRFAIHPGEVLGETIAARRRLEQLERFYRDGRSPLPVRGRDVVLVDDGSSGRLRLRAAFKAVHRLGPRRIIAAFPTAVPAVADLISGEADEVVCVMAPQPFIEVARWYASAPMVSHIDVQTILCSTRSRCTRSPQAPEEPQPAPGGIRFERRR